MDARRRGAAEQRSLRAKREELHGYQPEHGGLHGRLDLARRKARLRTSLRDLPQTVVPYF
eukprot:6174570-Pleurochrysis_carterae.AAC.4